MRYLRKNLGYIYALAQRKVDGTYLRYWDNATNHKPTVAYKSYVRTATIVPQATLETL